MVDELEIIGNEVHPLPILVYGRPGCAGTALVRGRLERLRVPFVEVDVEQDEAAARYVEHINHGQLTTPTLVFGDENFIVVEPEMNELNQALRRAGYEA